MKNCKCCGIQKPLDSFHRHPQCLDGRQSKCIECVRLRRLEISEKPKPKRPGEGDWLVAVSRIQYESGPHGPFPVPPQPAPQRAFSMGAA